MAQKQKVAHKLIVQFAQQHREMLYTQIAAHFGLSACRVSAILRAAGVYRRKRGRPVKRKPGESELQHKWEQILQNAGLGMDAGMRLNDQRIFYSPNPLGELPFEDPTF